MKKLITILFVVILVILGFIYTKQPSSEKALLPINNKVSPTPFPFREMTIPYLREREYKSALKELELVNKSGAYTSYLTSYDSDGFEINGLITIPAGEAPANGWPAIIFIHGYIPPAQYQTLEKYESYVDYLGRNGFVVFKIDLRGHGNSEGEPGGAYYSPDYVIDTLNAHAALQNADFINPQAIGLWGHSMAGNVILRTLAAKPDIAAAVIWAGAVYSYEDMQEYGISDSSYVPPPSGSPTRRLRRKIIEQMGQFSPESPFWKQVAATNYLSEIKGALQIHHAVNDDVVSIEYSRNLLELAKKANASVELVEHSSGGHNITDPSFVPAMEDTVDFFKKHLSQ